MIDDKSTGAPGNKKMEEFLAEWNSQPYKLIGPSTIKVSKEFRFNGAGLWLGMETTCLHGEEIAEFKKSHQLLNDAFHAMNPQQSWIPPSGFTTESTLEKVIPEINLEKERVEILIDNAETVEELNRYKESAEKYGVMDQWAAKLFNVKHK